MFIKLSNTKYVCELYADLDIAWGDGTIGVVIDPTDVAKYYQLVGGVWVFLYNQEDVPEPQGALISGTSIKTINGNSLLGSGNISVGGGSFSGTMDDIDNGATYVKTENNFNDSYKSDLDGLDVAFAGKSDDSHDHDSDYSALSHSHPISEITDLQTELDGKSDTGHTHDYAASSHNHDATYEAKNVNIQAHIISAHAPSDSQKNSDITKAEIEAKLTGAISSHTHDYAASNHNHDATYLPITRTKAQFDTACTDGNFLYVGDVTGGDIVYAPTLADVAINNVADVTVQTKDLTGIVAGDQVIIEGEFLILNNSTATRVYIITIDFDSAFDIEFTTPALATSATLMHPFMFRAVCNIRSTSLAYGMASLDMQLAAGIASGGDTTMAATHLSCKGWGESASNLTGTLTCNLKIRSAAGTATQTYRPISFTIRKTSPVG